ARLVEASGGGAAKALSVASEAQRLAALASLPEAVVDSLGVASLLPNVLASARQAVADAQGAAGSAAALQQQLATAETFWALAEWSRSWQDSCPLQRSGGSALTAQCAALRCWTLLRGGGQPVAPGPQSTQTGQPQSPPTAMMVLQQWPAMRTTLLQLRVSHQAGILYERFGSPHLADVCFQSGLLLMSQKLCGDRRWQLRFLCGRARLAMAGHPTWSNNNNSNNNNNNKELPALRPVEDTLREVEDLWNGQLSGEPRIGEPRIVLRHSGELSFPTAKGSSPGRRRAPPQELLELWAASVPGRSSPDELLRSEAFAWLLRGRAAQGSDASVAVIGSDKLSLALQLLSEHHKVSSRLWASCTAQAAARVAERDPDSPLPSCLCRGLLASAEALAQAFCEIAVQLLADDEKAMALALECRKALSRQSSTLRSGRRALLQEEELTLIKK
ncbi:unnamed protein product, partial [Polarella glacialis]